MATPGATAPPPALLPQIIFQQHNELLYNHASKEGLDPNIISNFHQFISILDSTTDSKRKIEILAILSANATAFLPFLTKYLLSTSPRQCTYEIRSKLYASPAVKATYAPQHDDYATLAWGMLRYLRCLILDKDTNVRAQALRAVRYFCSDDVMIQSFMALGVDYLISRSIEREHRYVDERLQALKLIRHIVSFASQLVTRPIILTLLAIAELQKEEFRVVALDAVKDLLLTQPVEMLNLTNCRQIVIDAILDPALSELSSPLTWTLLYLYDNPSTRHFFAPSYDFGRLFACYTDLTSTIVNTIDQQPGAVAGQMNSAMLMKTREQHRASAHRVLLTFMRSLGGLFALSSEPILLQSFIHMLSLPSRIPSVSWAKEGVFEFLYDTLRIVTSYDLVTHKRALINYAKQRNFLAHKQHLQHQQQNPSRALHFSQGQGMSSGYTNIRHVNLLHTYMVLVLTICIKSGLLEHLSILTLSSSDELSQPALKLLAEILRLSFGLFPHSIAAQLQTFPSLLQNAVLINPTQHLSLSTQQHNTSIPLPVDPSLNALSYNFHAPHTTPHYITSLNSSPLDAISNPSATAWNLFHQEQSSQTSIRIQSLHALTHLFQENVKFLSVATSQDTFLFDHERNTSVGLTQTNQGVHSIGDSTDGICKTSFTDHGFDLSRLLLETDQTSSRHSFLSSQPLPVPSVKLGAVPSTATAQVVGRPHKKSRELQTLYLQSQTQHSEAYVMALLKQTNVLATKDQFQWDFTLILQLLETCVLSRVHFNTILMKTKFFKRLLSFLRPDKNMFAAMYLTIPHASLHAKVAAQLIRVVVMYPEGRDYQFFLELIDLIIDCLSEEAQRAESVAQNSVDKHPAHQIMRTHVLAAQNKNEDESSDGPSVNHSVSQHSGGPNATTSGGGRDTFISMNSSKQSQQSLIDANMMMELGLVDGEIGSPMYQYNQGFYSHTEGNKDGALVSKDGVLIQGGPEHSKLQSSSTVSSTGSSLLKPKGNITSFFKKFNNSDKKDSIREDSVSHMTKLKSPVGTNRGLPSGHEPSRLARNSILGGNGGITPSNPYEEDSRLNPSLVAFHQPLQANQTSAMGHAPGAPSGPGATGPNSFMAPGSLHSPPRQPTTGGANGASTDVNPDEDGLMQPRFRPFSHYSIVNKLCREYVTIMGILSETPYGLTILLKYGFFDLIAPFGACPEYDYLSRQFLFHLDFTNITSSTVHSTTLLEYWVLHGSTFLRRSIISLLRTIARQNVEKFKYLGLELSIALTHSPDPQVSLSALSLLEEACHIDPSCVELVINRAPDLSHFGQFVSNLYYSFLSKPDGVELLLKNGWLIDQMKLWNIKGLREYVENSEYHLSLALSNHLDISAEDTTEGGNVKVSSLQLAAKDKSDTKPEEDKNQLQLPNQSPYLGNIPSLVPLLNPKTSLWSQYTLYQPQLWSTRIPVYQDHDEYMRKRLFQIPWNVEISIETSQRRMIQLLVDSYVMEGFADSGSLVVNDIMNANPYYAKHYNLTTLVTQDSVDNYNKYEQDIVGKIQQIQATSVTVPNSSIASPSPLSHESSYNGGYGPTSATTSKDTTINNKNIQQQLLQISNPPKPLLVENELEGTPCLWVCALCLDVEGKPTPIEIDPYATLHSRLSPYILSTDQMPIGSSSIRQQGVMDNTNPYSNFINSDNTKIITSQYVDNTVILPPKQTNQPITAEIRKCYPFDRKFHLLPSLYNIDNQFEIYSDQNTQANHANWTTYTEFKHKKSQRWKALVPSQPSLPLNLSAASQNIHASQNTQLPSRFHPSSLIDKVTDLDYISPYHAIPNPLSQQSQAVLTLTSPTSCSLDVAIDINNIEVSKITTIDFPTKNQFSGHLILEADEETDDEAPPPPPPPLSPAVSQIPLPPPPPEDDEQSVDSFDDDSTQDPNEPHDYNQYGTLQCKLPVYSQSSFYYLDGNVRWNFYRDPARPDKLFLTSVWFKISPTCDILPSVSVMPHLYGELSKTITGCGLLYNSNTLHRLARTVCEETTSSFIQRRAALWGLAQIGTSEYGVRMLIRHGLVSYLTSQALHSPILSFRGTCFYLIGLLGLSRTGREHLDVLGWDCTEEDAQIASIGIALPRDILSFLHVQTTPLSQSYALQPLLTNPLQSPHAPSTIAPTLSTAPAQPQPQPKSSLSATIFNVTNTSGNVVVDVDEEIYRTYTNGVEAVPITALDPGSEKQRAVDAQVAEVLGHCEKTLYGVPNQAAIELVLGHVSNLCNHVSQRASLNTLRLWKQEYKVLFSSPILFAKVVQLLQTHTFGLPARRFIIFELFGRVFSSESTFKGDIDAFISVLVDHEKPNVVLTPDQIKQIEQIHLETAKQKELAKAQSASNNTTGATRR